jgi:hypothetical protein
MPSDKPIRPGDDRLALELARSRRALRAALQTTRGVRRVRDSGADGTTVAATVRAARYWCVQAAGHLLACLVALEGSEPDADT